MWALGILLSFSTFAFGYIIVGNDVSEEGIIWPTEYYFKGEKLDLNLQIKKSFEIWYSGKLNRSRVTYFNTDTTYFYGETDNEYGYTYKVYPTTSIGLTITEQCDEEHTEGPAQDFLPSTEEYVYSGTEIYNNKTVSIWSLINEKEESDEDNQTEEHILYVYKHSSNDFDLPLRYDTKKYNKWTKSLSMHTISEFYDFKVPESSDLDAKKVEACEYAKIGTDLKKALSLYQPDSSSGLEKAFRAYKHHHKRQFDQEEHEMRRQIFKNNWRKVIEHNEKNLSYKMAINQFSDRTPEELSHLSGTYSNPLGKGTEKFPHTEEELRTIVEDLPENFNMKHDGVISRIKNQGSCGSCWAFATTGAVEGALARINGGLNIDLSEQSLVDCAWGFGNYGCGGGLMDRALKYVMEYGIADEQAYGPYLEQNGKCNIENMTNVYNIRGFARIPPLSVNAMKVALYKYGPVIVAIYASDNLMHYSNGVYYDLECTADKHINHAVLVVGYGVRDGALYWIVKNSWGEDWGQDGYVFLSATNDNCLLLTEAYYPIV